MFFSCEKYQHKQCLPPEMFFLVFLEKAPSLPIILLQKWACFLHVKSDLGIPTTMSCGWKASYHRPVRSVLGCCLHQHFLSGWRRGVSWEEGFLGLKNQEKRRDDAVLWMKMFSVGSHIWMLISQVVTCLGRVMRCNLTGGGVSPELGFDISRAHTRPSFSLSACCLWTVSKPPSPKCFLS